MSYNDFSELSSVCLDNGMLLEYYPEAMFAIGKFLPTGYETLWIKAEGDRIVLTVTVEGMRQMRRTIARKFDDFFKDKPLQIDVGEFLVVLTHKSYTFSFRAKNGQIEIETTT
jgi:hypothetical protein